MSTPLAPIFRNIFLDLKHLSEAVLVFDHLTPKVTSTGGYSDLLFG